MPSDIPHPAAGIPGWHEAIFRSAPVGLAVFDGEGRFVAINRRLSEMSGYNEADLPALTFEHVLYPDDQARVTESFCQLQTGEIDRAALKIRFFRKDGNIERAYVAGTAARAVAGRLAFLVCTVEHITDNERSEHTLAGSVAHLREAQALAHVGSFYWDAAGDRLIWSDELYRIHGQDPGTFTATYQAHLDQIHPDHRKQVETIKRRAIEAGEPFELEYRLVRPTGEIRWVLVRGRPVQGTAALEGICQDITERKRAEEAIRKVSAFREAIIHSAAEGICVHKTAPEFPFLVFTVWNERMEEITGYTIEEINRLGWCETLYLDSTAQARAWRQIHSMRAGNHLNGEEYEIIRKDKARRVVSTTTSKVECDDGTPAVIVLMQDVTERRRIERKLQETQKLDSLGILAGGIAHDFNNLLTAMLGYAELARADLPAEGRAAAAITEVEKAVYRAADLTRQMLAYSGRGRFIVQPLNLSALVREILLLLQSAVSKKATLQCDCPDDLPAIEGDKLQLRQVVMNLVINASDALEEQSGTIDVRTKVIEAGGLDDPTSPELPRGRYVCLEVADDGCGMTEETRTKIFDPFFSTKFTGRGLGLAAVQGIVRGHRGVIAVESEPGKGSRFRVLFPFVDQAVIKPATAAAALSPALQGSKTVLVVEDEDVVREMVRLVLENVGYRVLEARNGCDGIELFTMHAAEVTAVLLDLTMPQMNGMETLAKIRQLRPEMPVVLMSGYSEGELAGQFVGLKLSNFLQKPFDNARLLAVIHQVLATG